MFAQNEIMLNAFLTLCSPQKVQKVKKRRRGRQRERERRRGEEAQKLAGKATSVARTHLHVASGKGAQEMDPSR